jgi:hypothetical protein
VAILQPQIFLDLLDQASAQVLAAAVHRENAHPRSSPNQQMSTVTRLERAAMLRKPSLELTTGHIGDDTTLLLYLEQVC